MKKLFVISALLLCLSFITPVSAQAYYPPQLEYYDAQIEVLEPRLNAFQSAYYAVNGRYYQALQSHATVPDVPEVPDGIDSSPTDQPETLAYFWDVFAELPSALAWSFSIDVYNAPAGDGYVLKVMTVIDGEVWARAINYGPASEDWRAVDWYQVVPLFGF